MLLLGNVFTCSSNPQLCCSVLQELVVTLKTTAGGELLWTRSFFRVAWCWFWKVFKSHLCLLHPHFPGLTALQGCQQKNDGVVWAGCYLSHGLGGVTGCDMVLLTQDVSNLKELSWCRAIGEWVRGDLGVLSQSTRNNQALQRCSWRGKRKNFKLLAASKRVAGLQVRFTVLRARADWTCTASAAEVDVHIPAKALLHGRSIWLWSAIANPLCDPAASFVLTDFLLRLLVSTRSALKAEIISLRD